MKETKDTFFKRWNDHDVFIDGAGEFYVDEEDQRFSADTFEKLTAKLAKEERDWKVTEPLPATLLDGYHGKPKQGAITGVHAGNNSLLFRLDVPQERTSYSRGKLKLKQATLQISSYNFDRIYRRFTEEDVAELESLVKAIEEANGARAAFLEERRLTKNLPAGKNLRQVIEARTKVEKKKG